MKRKKKVSFKGGKEKREKGRRSMAVHCSVPVRFTGITTVYQLVKGRPGRVWCRTKDYLIILSGSTFHPPNHAAAEYRPDCYIVMEAETHLLLLQLASRSNGYIESYINHFSIYC